MFAELIVRADCLRTTEHVRLATEQSGRNEQSRTVEQSYATEQSDSVKQSVANERTKLHTLHTRRKWGEW